MTSTFPISSRFLRARKFDVEGAFAQFTTTETWRKKEAVDSLFDDFPVEEFGLSQQVYTQYTGRRTKSGQPLYVYKVGALTKEKVNEYSKKGDRLEPRMIVLSEVSCCCLRCFKRLKTDRLGFRR